MMRLLTGDVGAGKTTACLHEIARFVGEGVSCLMIVPEQETVVCEETAASVLPPESALRFSVTNFTRLANEAFRRLGGVARTEATPDVKAQIMFHTLTRISPFLHTPFSRVDGGLVDRCLTCERHLHMNRLTPDDLREMAADTDDPTLKKKLEDMATVSRFFRDALAEKYADGDNDLTLLSRALAETRCFAGVRFFVDGFSSFVEQQYAVLRELVAHEDVTVTLTLPRDADKTICAAELRDTERRLRKLASDAGVPIEVEDLGGNRRVRNPLLSYVTGHLWRIDAPAAPPSGEGLSMVTAADPYDAADYVAADIRRRVMDEGAAYGDFAVVAADAALYEGILDTALNRAGVPAFFAGSASLSQYEPIKFIRAAYAVLCRGWKRADVSALLKYGMCDISREQGDELEIYLDAWSLEGAALNSDKPLTNNPNGYAALDKEGRVVHERLARINRTKDALRDLLRPLYPSARAHLTVREHAAALTDFLCACGMQKRLAHKAAVLRDLGEETAAADHSRLWQTICDALDRLVEAVGDEPVSCETFRTLSDLTFASCRIGRLPPSRDEVTVGSAPTLRMENKRHVYLFGLNDGEFPAPPPDDPLFSEGELARLRRRGRYPEVSADVRAERELFFCYRAAASASETLTCLSFAADGTGSSCRPSYAWERILSLAGPSCRPLSTREQDGGAYLYHPDAALTRLGSLLGSVTGETLRRWFLDHGDYRERAGIVSRPLVAPSVTVEKETVDRLWPAEISLSQTQLESFVKCPFSYYSQTVMKLHDGAPFAFGRREIGNFVHDLLQTYVERAFKTGLTGRGEIEAAARAAADDYLDRTVPPVERDTARIRHLGERLAKTAGMILSEAIEECSTGGFRPVLFELPVGYENSPSAPPIPLSDGRTLTMHGRVDRVDAWRSPEGEIYVRVVDYKTGSKTFDPKDLRRGVNLQLYIYLDALLSADGIADLAAPGEKVRPAGILYFACMPNAKTVSAPKGEEETEAIARGEMKRSGLFLADRSVLEQMSKRTLGLKENEGPDKIKKDVRRTSEEWQTIFDDLHETLAAIGSDMLSGRADARPMLGKSSGSPCDYCAYYPVCRNTKKKKAK